MSHDKIFFNLFSHDRLSTFQFVAVHSSLQYCGLQKYSKVPIHNVDLLCGL